MPSATLVALLPALFQISACALDSSSRATVTGKKTSKSFEFCKTQKAFRRGQHHAKNGEQVQLKAYYQCPQKGREQALDAYKRGHDSVTADSKIWLQRSIGAKLFRCHVRAYSDRYTHQGHSLERTRRKVREFCLEQHRSHECSEPDCFELRSAAE